MLDGVGEEGELNREMARAESGPTALSGSIFGRRMAVGEDEAASMGVSVARARGVLFGLAGVLTALSVWIAGPLAFVGLVAPHFVRLLVGPEHRVVVPLSVLAGAALVVLSDGVVELASRNLHIGRIPVGVVTAVVGGPVFIVLLRRHLKGSNQLA